jgi:acyl-CoA synthetase (AMP-forming)/AMP-acid ligase II
MSGATWSELYAELAYSDRPALVTADRPVSFAELTALATAVAGWLDDLGAPADQPVATLISDAVDASALTLAALATRRPLAPLNVRSTPAELAIVLERLAPSMLVAEPDVIDVAREAGSRLGLLTIALTDAASSRTDLDFTTARPDQTAVILHTSGTTSAPKPVPYRQGPLAERVRVNSRLLQLGPGSRYATAAPFHHAAGVGNLLVALGCGAAMCPLSRFGDHTWDEIIAIGATHVTLVPTMIDRVLAQGDLQPGAVRRLQYGGSSIHPDTVRQLLETLPDVEFIQLYGQTEATPLTALTMADHRRAINEGAWHLLETAGRPIDGVELRLGDTDAQGVGEVLVRAAHLMLPGDDGWVHTGDLASIDDEGYVTIVGRKGDMMIRGGENVYPDEIEGVLVRHPCVAEVAVVGKPDRQLGHIVTAHLVLEAGTTSPSDEDLRAFVRVDLAGFKVPEQWHWLDTLPRTASGKVLRREL